jgi:hypothetical protein
MLPLQIKRQRSTEVDPKEVLRAHVYRLPPDKQSEFIATAVQLIAKRSGINEVEIMARYGQLRQDVKHSGSNEIDLSAGWKI